MKSDQGIFHVREVDIKTTRRCHLPPVRMAVIRETSKKWQ